MDFVLMDINPTNKAVEDYMERLMYDRGIECERLKRTIHLASSLVEVSSNLLARFSRLNLVNKIGYHNCTLEEKKNLALFNW